MFAAYFGEIKSGELGRVRFVGLSSLVLGLFAILSVGLGVRFGLKNVLPVFLPLAGVLGFALLNLAAKRWRNIGLSGWSASLSIGLAAVLALWFAPRAAGLLAIACVFLLEATLPARSKIRAAVVPSAQRT